MTDASRIPIGIWSELPPGARWANEGISRIVGFLIEGGAETGQYVFRVLVPNGMAEIVRADLRTLIATEDLDWTVHEPTVKFEEEWRSSGVGANLSPKEGQRDILARWANTQMKVDGWINTFPHFTGTRWLNQRKAVLLPDAIPYDFPIGWDYAHYWGKRGEWVEWKGIARETLADGQAIIAHSKHVAQRHGVKLLGLPAEKIRVVPHAPPDLAPILPFIKDRKKTPETVRIAAGIIRDYAATRSIDYLRNFPFEEVPFALVATQDRVTKNVGRAAEAVRRMVRRDRTDFKLFTTAPMHWGANWTLLPGLVEGHQFLNDLVSMPDVPRDVHAALFHCAKVTIHPTFYEGIVGTLTFYESVSVGTPCIMGTGPHVRELLETEPELEPLVFDPYDIEGLITMVRGVLADPEGAVDLQRPAYERRRKRGWDKVAQAYANAAAGLDEASGTSAS